MKRCALLAVAVGLAVVAPCSGQEGNPVVEADTTLGKIHLELFADKAPATVKNFLRYVDDKFYDDTIFHRVIENFMIQGGGLDADLKEKATRPPIANEAGNGLSNVRGTVAMARTVKPDSATAQFYINVQDNVFLDRAKTPDRVGYAVFGRVIAGMEVVDRIRKVKTARRGGHGDVPVEPVVIRSLRRAAELTLVVSGSLAPGKVFSIAAYVDFPTRGQALTLELPPGVVRVEGKEIQPVPLSAAGKSLVLWKARIEQSGEFTIKVRSSTGIIRSRTISTPAPKSLEQPAKKK
jgi:peptidyl-prolyl cis-trans isomerase B (cyclophilin B)